MCILFYARPSHSIFFLIHTTQLKVLLLLFDLLTFQFSSNFMPIFQQHTAPDQLMIHTFTSSFNLARFLLLLTNLLYRIDDIQLFRQELTRIKPNVVIMSILCSVRWITS